MVDATWIATELTLAVALGGCILLAAADARRVGLHTPYGSVLATIAVGFWGLLWGHLARALPELALGTRRGPPSLADAFDLLGWAGILGAFVLFAFRFSARGSLRRRAAKVTMYVLPPMLLAGAVFFLVLMPGANPRDPAVLTRLAYFLIDGAAAGLLVASLKRLVALRESALGRLYGLLGVALLLTTAADVVRNYAIGRGSSAGAIDDVLVALAGVVALAALLLHHRVLRRSHDAHRYADPTAPVPVRVLRDATEHLRGLVGEAADAIVLQAATETLRARGVAHEVRGGRILCEASDGDWRAVLLRVQEEARRHLGDAALDTFDAAARAWGSDFDYLRKQVQG